MKTSFNSAFAATLLPIVCTATQIANGAALQAQYLDILLPVDLPAGAQFGGESDGERRVDLSGSLAAVGAGLFRQGANVGRAYVYDLSVPTDVQRIATLQASDNSAGNEYGDGVAVSGNFVFVGAHGDGNNHGAVYMYDFSDRNHIVERKITAFDAAPQNEFGFSLAVDGSRLVVGAPKFAASSLPPAVYIVDFSNPNQLTQTKIVTPLGNSGYGKHVDISGNYVVVGQDIDSQAFPGAGSAHLYDISNLNSIARKRLTPTDAPNYSQFGERVSISGTKALVSVASDPGPLDPPGAPEGAVWAFDFSNWNQIKQFEYGRSTFHPGDFSAPFGRGLDLEGNLAFAGAFNEGNALGAAYLHDVTSVLAPVELLRIPPHAAGDFRFGGALAVDGRNFIISDLANHVYLYRLVVPEPTAAQLTIMVLAICQGPRRWRAVRRLANGS